MNIKPMLARLQTTIGWDELSEEMLLLPGIKNSIEEENESAKPLTLIVGYNDSSNSHAALDLALLIAHQTRLATSKQVVVKVVYIIERNQNNGSADFGGYTIEKDRAEFLTTSTSISVTPVLMKQKISAVATVENCQIKPTCSTNNSLLEAEGVLWKARCLVEEWRDSFIAHLRVGKVAVELRKVVDLEAADLLILGCQSDRHLIIQQLGGDFPCPVLGIPSSIVE